MDTHEECIIGTISKVIFSHGKYYILDSKSAKQIFVFDSLGKFLSHIEKIGKGPGEFIRPVDFCIDNKANYILIIDADRKVSKVDLNGNFILEKSSPVQNRAITNIVSENGIIYAYTGQRMSNRFFYLSVSFLIIIFITLVFLKKYRENLSLHQEKYDNLSLFQKNFEGIVQDQIELDGDSIDDWILQNLNGDQVRISDLIKKQDCTFSIFSEFSCMSCLQENLSFIPSKMKPPEKLVLICGFNNLLQVINWSKENNYQNNVYLFSDYGKCRLSRRANFPYIFKADMSLHITKTISLRMNNSLLFESFLEGIPH